MKRGHALVIGQGLAGKATALIMAQFFERVSLLDKENTRKSIEGTELSYSHTHPQVLHSHILLSSGLKILGKLFPDCLQKLESRGYKECDYSQDFLLFGPSGELPRFRSGLKSRPVPRPLLDEIFTEALSKNSRIQLHTGKVIKLEMCPKRQSIKALYLQQEEIVQGCEDFDFIFDCSGRTSQVPALLEEATGKKCEEEWIRSGTSYVTQFFRYRGNWNYDWRACEISSLPPHNPYACGMAIYPDNLVQISNISIAHGKAAQSQEEFFAQWKKLQSNTIEKLKSQLEIISPLYRYQRIDSRWLRYDRFKNYPVNLIPVGDSLCAFNPIYRSGITLLLKELDCLQSLFKENSNINSKKYFKRMKPSLQNAWNIASLEDFSWPTTEGQLSFMQKLSRFYFAKLSEIRRPSQALLSKMLHILHLEKSPYTLLRPSIALEILSNRKSPT